MQPYKDVESRVGKNNGDSGGRCAVTLSQRSIKSRTHKDMQELRNFLISYTNSKSLDKEL